MSGPKGVSVVVVAPEELERRALVAARAYFDVVRARAERLRAAIASAAARGVSVPAPPPRAAQAAGRSAEVQRAAQDLSAACNRLERELREAVGRHLAQQVLGKVTSTIAKDDGESLVVTPRDAFTMNPRVVREARPALDSERRGEADDTWRSGVAASVARALSRFPHPDGALREEIERHASAVLAAPSRSRAEALLMTLQDDVGAAATRARRRAQAEREVELLEARVRALAEPDSSDLAGRIEHLRRSGLDEGVPRELVADIEAAEARTRVEADRRFALQIAVECLAALGYEVDEGFETVAGKEVSYLHRHRWPDHAVQITARPGAPLIGFNVVRSEDADVSAADAEIEAGWCEDLRLARDRARERGVLIDVVRSQPPGARPVQAVPSERVRTRRRRAAQQPQVRSRRVQ